jgi:hypothetical protein
LFVLKQQIRLKGLLNFDIYGVQNSEDVRGHGGTATHILNFETKLKIVMSFTLNAPV